MIQSFLSTIFSIFKKTVSYFIAQFFYLYCLVKIPCPYHISFCRFRQLYISKTQIFRNLTALSAQKMKFPVKDRISNCEKIRSYLQIYSHLLQKSLMKNFIFGEKICSFIHFTFNKEILNGKLYFLCSDSAGISTNICRVYRGNNPKFVTSAVSNKILNKTPPHHQDFQNCYSAELPATVAILILGKV